MINRNEFVKKLAENMGTSQKDARACLDAVLETMTGYFYEGQEVKFLGFGSFPVVMVKARTCRNPNTGAKITVPAYMKVTFRPGRALRMKA